jgi:hypothetical protein
MKEGNVIATHDDPDSKNSQWLGIGVLLEFPGYTRHIKAKRMVFQTELMWVLNSLRLYGIVGGT